MRLEQLSGAGNHFLLLDARFELELPGGALPDGVTAKEWCAAAAQAGGPETDGVLVLTQSEVAAARLEIWNADGSLAAACGNGLRCAGWLLLREGDLKEVAIETQTGIRKVSGEAAEGGAECLEAELGPVTVEKLHGSFALLEGERAAWRGDVGNPHCVFLVDDVRSEQLERRGRALQADPTFPKGVNVGYLGEEGGAWRLRVFERGAGETGACGTGAAAAAAVLREAFGLSLPLSLELPAGTLSIAEVANGGLSVAGGVEHRGALILGAEGFE
jgi:diaminopimelate epimerase